MIGVDVYHQVKALRKDYSQEEVAHRLGRSVNTIRKYNAMSVEQAADYFGSSQRSSQFDTALEFIEEQLGRFPKISAVKLLRQVKVRYPEITGKARAFRDYLAPLRANIKPDQQRRYEPVLDMVAGQQVQVDPGEKTIERADGSSFKVYFVVFIFSYSRHRFVTFRSRPYNTAAFIKAHLLAFQYFGGTAKEFVYDQTKLVVIRERYREVLLNAAFYQFSLRCGFEVRVCEGYDPQSKGKVERGVQDVKQDFLYGDYFKDVADVNNRSKDWLDTVVNARIHSVTGRAPAEMFEEEKSLLETRYALISGPQQRLVDKTGLLSFEGNKYSAPSAYQRQHVAVKVDVKQLILLDVASGKEIARHTIPAGKGQIVKNNNHYRDYKKSVAELTDEVMTALPGLGDVDVLIERIKTDNPKIVRDQLRGLRQLGHRFETVTWQAAMPVLLKLPQLRATLVESVLAGYLNRQQAQPVKEGPPLSDSRTMQKSCLDRSLDSYMEVIEC